MKNLIDNIKNWSSSDIYDFWSKEAFCNHVVQVYDTEDVFLDTITSYFTSGLIEGETALLIATPSHITKIYNNLKERNIDIDSPFLKSRYIVLDAEKTLSKFIVNGKLDENLFFDIIEPILETNLRLLRKLRIFGGMVALLCQQGKVDIAHEIECLWNRLQEKYHFTLFCAFHRDIYKEGAHMSLDNLCSSHTKIISGNSSLSPLIRFHPWN